MFHEKIGHDLWGLPPTVRLVRGGEGSQEPVRNDNRDILMIIFWRYMKKR